MPVTSTHPDYETSTPDWSRARDVLAGEDALKAGGEKYLPRIEAQTHLEYANYRRRACFFNATARTAEGYIGLIFRRPPFFKLPESQAPSPLATRHSSLSSEGRGEVAVPSSPATRRSSLPQAEVASRSDSLSASGGEGRGEVAPSGSTLHAQRSTPADSGHASRITHHASRINSQLSTFLTDSDLMGTSFAAYAKNVVTEVVGIGRAGTLVDWEGDFEDRAYVSMYSAEQIINWRVERVNGRNVLTMLVLRETGNQLSTLNSQPSTTDDPFEDQTVDQIRVLRLVPSGSLSAGGEGRGEVDPSRSTLHAPRSTLRAAGAAASLSAGGEGRGEVDSRLSTLNHQPSTCLVELWQPKPTQGREDTEEWQLVDTRIPLRLGKPLPLIPFIFHGARHSRPDVDKPPLNDIIAVNLDHFRLDADYKHGLHFTALPTAWVSGFDKSSRLRIGSSTAWVAEAPGASAGFLEFTGQGLTSFERAMDRDERLMAVLGSRLLEDQKKVGETAEAIELRQSGENSVLSSIATSVSESLTQVLRWVYWWNSTEEVPDDVSESQVLIKLNTDFSLKGMTSQELQAVVQAWQANAISRDTMLELFRKGEILPDGRTNEEEVRRLANLARQGTPASVTPA